MLVCVDETSKWWKDLCGFTWTWRPRLVITSSFTVPQREPKSSKVIAFTKYVTVFILCTLESSKWNIFICVWWIYIYRTEVSPFCDIQCTCPHFVNFPWEINKVSIYLDSNVLLSTCEWMSEWGNIVKCFKCCKAVEKCSLVGFSLSI